MIRHIPKVALLLGALALAGQAQAHGGGPGWGGAAVIGAVVGGVVGAAVVNSGPRTVYVQQEPVYAPAPVYYEPPPPPVYYQPAYVVQQPVYYGPPRHYGPPRGYYGPPPGYYRDGGPGRW